MPAQSSRRQGSRIHARSTSTESRGGSLRANLQKDMVVYPPFTIHVHTNIISRITPEGSLSGYVYRQTLTCINRCTGLSYNTRIATFTTDMYGIICSYRKQGVERNDHDGGIAYNRRCCPHPQSRYRHCTEDAQVWRNTGGIQVQARATVEDQRRESKALHRSTRTAKQSVAYKLLQKKSVGSSPLHKSGQLPESEPYTRYLHVYFTECEPTFARVVCPKNRRAGWR